MNDKCSYPDCDNEATLFYARKRVCLQHYLISRKIKSMKAKLRNAEERNK